MMAIENDIRERSVNEAELIDAIKEMRKKLGDKVFILGHHYQRDDIIRFADKAGDSFGLSKYVAENVKSPYIIFCGVHFMAETADILTPDDKTVILPDLEAGCTMADMANLRQVEKCWDILKEATSDKIIPVTYVNSTAEIKAFCGRNGGTVCTSANADKILKWAFTQGEKVLFLPDQHLGRNTGYNMGIPLDEMSVYDPLETGGGASPEEYSNSKIILWQGFCSVHMNFLPQNVDHMRKKHPDINILVHPECTFETVSISDYQGSTSKIIKTVEEAPSGTIWAIGTEQHLVNRLKNEHPDKFIASLAPFECQCETMFRIDPEHLLESLVLLDKGEIGNRIAVPKEIADDARTALDKMLEIS
ncbi:MAG: quinolinate synthase NadA [bacterium]|nr:quinolinate synthase NadA [bacterium]